MRRIEQSAQFFTEIKPRKPASFIIIIFIPSAYKFLNPPEIPAWDLKITRALTFLAFCYRKDIQRIRTLRVLSKSEIRDSPCQQMDRSAIQPADVREEAINPGRRKCIRGEKMLRRLCIQEPRWLRGQNHGNEWILMDFSRPFTLPRTLALF
jgi:hypothetical protein